MSIVRALFHRWEHRLATRDDFERRVLPFEWGAAHLPPFGDWRVPSDDSSEAEIVALHVDRALEQSDAYFELPPIEDYRLEGDVLSFTSAAPTGVVENDLVRATYFPVSGNGDRADGPAVVVLPQWNSRVGAQAGLCRLLNHFDLTALKVALPYHEGRMPPDSRRADYTLSPNIGRTLQSVRQAVLDARACVTWLAEAGYGPIGIIGTSLGSCIAFITFAHEPLLETAVFNHISPYFADVVWHGISTRQVREGLEKGIQLDPLRRLWLPLSPYAYYERLRATQRRCLLIYGKYDLSFPPDLSLALLEDFRRLEIDHEVFALPCGHYTTAKFPFNWMDGLSISRFVSKELKKSS